MNNNGDLNMEKLYRFWFELPEDAEVTNSQAERGLEITIGMIVFFVVIIAISCFSILTM
jgi:hypothetical protein